MDNERVGRRDDGTLTFPRHGDIENQVVELTEQGADAGMSDEEIAQIITEYLTIAYRARLH
jgi:hypothetical protein